MADRTRVDRRTAPRRGALPSGQSGRGRDLLYALVVLGVGAVVLGLL